MKLPEGTESLSRGQCDFKQLPASIFSESESERRLSPWLQSAKSDSESVTVSFTTEEDAAAGAISASTLRQLTQAQPNRGHGHIVNHSHGLGRTPPTVAGSWPKILERCDNSSILNINLTLVPKWKMI